MPDECSSFEGSSSQLAASDAGRPSSPHPSHHSVDTVVVTSSPHGIWAKFNPHRRFHLLKTAFILLCLSDTVHWACMLRDDDEISPNAWKFYVRINGYDHYYLILRMFADIFVGVIGLGASMWTKKFGLAIPCLLVQSFFFCARGLTWLFRGPLPEDHRFEDVIFIAFEFILPFTWMLLSMGVMRTIRSISQYDRLRGTQQPPVIVLTVKNDNDESVQFQINP